jgi:8-oxo-dGTP diphosphatase
MGLCVTLRASVGILVNEDGRILFAERSPTVHTFPEHWEFPGGQVAEGESFLDALRRELNEELGVLIETSPSLLRKACSLDDRGRTWLVCTYVYPLRGQVPSIREPEKCSKIGFFDPRRPPEPLLDAAKEDLRIYCESPGE